jgi:hypothetical protein
MFNLKTKFETTTFFGKIFISFIFTLLVLLFFAIKNDSLTVFITGAMIPLFCSALALIVWGLVSLPLKNIKGGLVIGLFVGLATAILSGYYLLQIEDQHNMQKIQQQADVELQKSMERFNANR